jgi:hypothetical protein
MTEDLLRGLLEDVRTGAADVDAAMRRLRHMPFEDLGFAKVDHHRALRHGIPEVVFGLGKSVDHVVSIAGSLLERGGGNVLITRTSSAMAERVLHELPGGEYFPLSGAIRYWRDRALHGKGKIAVVCAGMEGALPSAVGGIVSVPVIAVPTSVGYGASFNGLAALLGMLNSCASNVTVVNIDNGFGAGYVASLINRL